jgi:hypothetical protein
MAGVEEVEVMTGMAVRTEMAVRTGINDVRKEKKGEHHYNAGYMRLNWIWIKEAIK